MAEVVWTPQPGSQALFVSCPIFECLYEGTRGPGKTDALLMDFAQFCGRGFGAHWRGILFRRTFPQLADVVAKSKKWFYRIFPGIRYNESTHTWKWPTGEELLLRYINDPSDYWNYHGHEYPWIGWEELTNWPNLDCYEVMRSCCRSSHAGMPRHYRATANPYGVGHNAVKSMFIDPCPPGVIFRGDQGEERVRIHGHWRENKALLAADPDYPRRLASDSNTNRRKAWLDGNWDVVAGGRFDEVWRREVHVIRPFTIPSNWMVDRAYDHGSSAPFATIWFAESNGESAALRDGTSRCFPGGTLFAIAEDYGWSGKPNQGIRLSSHGIAQRVLEIEKKLGLEVEPGPADTAIYDIMDGRSTASEMERAGVRWERAAKGKGSRVTGWERIQDLLEAGLQSPMERAGLFIFDGCTQLIRTLPVLPRDDVNQDDVDTESEDHLADALRYRATFERRSIGEVEIFGM